MYEALNEVLAALNDVMYEHISKKGVGSISLRRVQNESVSLG